MQARRTCSDGVRVGLVLLGIDADTVALLDGWVTFLDKSTSCCDMDIRVLDSRYGGSARGGAARDWPKSCSVGTCPT